ncbi:MAG: Calx-beta domain-containing protein [Actinomycetota bacterium]
MRQGYLVPDQSAYERAKAAADSESRPGSPRAPVTSGRKSASVSAGAEGIYDSTHAPSDSTGAIGRTRYVEFVNTKYAIYDRADLSTPLDSGLLTDLADRSGSMVSDPQVIWDPDTSRFYYVILDLSAAGGGGSSNYLLVGFSTTDSPNTAADWCSWVAFDFELDLPDYPKLGDTKDFLLIGANTFDETDTFLEADLAWLKKPSAGVTCEAAGTPTGGVEALFDSDGGTSAWTPVPANQTDASSQGWVVATPNQDPPPGLIDLFSVTRASDGTADIQTVATPIAVASYSAPVDAPQAGSLEVLDTLDGRLTQAVSAVNPSRGCATVSLWTQHTIDGGAGARVRWYELDPVGAGVFQSGTISDSALYVYNGAVAPDRAVNGSERSFGDGMVVGFNTSSATEYVAIQMASKVGDEPISSWTVIKQSTGSNDDFGCAVVDPCRWGDYSGATPDPVADPARAHGSVWLTNTWVEATVGTSVSDWRTWNWEAAIDGTAAPLVLFQPASYVVGERGRSVPVQVVRTGPTAGDVTVDVAAIGGTATVGSDFGNPATTLTFPDGGTTAQTVTMTIIDDGYQEPAETIWLELQNLAGGAALGCASTAKVMIKASDQRPDNQIRIPGKGFIGNNVYSTDGSRQTLTVSGRRGRTQVFWIRIQNDGNYRNRFTVRAYTGGSSGYRVRFYYYTTSVGVTQSVTAGTYSTGMLTPGQARILRLEVTPGSGAGVGTAKSVLVRTTWSGDVTRMDAVKAVLKTTA